MFKCNSLHKGLNNKYIIRGSSDSDSYRNETIRYPDLSLEVSFTTFPQKNKSPQSNKKLYLCRSFKVAATHL